MKKSLFILLIVYSSCGFAQDNFTLKECIDYTLKNHPTLKIYSTNIAISNEKSKQNLADYLPQVNGSANSTNNLSLQSSIITSEFLGPNPVVLTLGSKYTTTAYVDITQSLIDPTKWAGIRSNKANIVRSNLELQQNKENLLYHTAVSFFQILIYKEQLKILEANREKYEQFHKAMQYQNEKGTVLEQDVNRIKVNLNSTNYQIQDAKTRLQLSYNILKNAMGMSLDEPLEIKDSESYEKYLQNSSEESLLLEYLTDYKLGENALTLEKMNLKTEKAKLYPSLSAIGRFGYQSLTNDFSDIYREWSDFSYIGLSLNIPIFNGLKQRSKVKEKRLQLENQIDYFNINKDKFKLAYENAKTSLDTSYSNYLSNKDNMELSQQVLQTTEYQYERGVVNLTNYLNDDTAFKKTQSDYLNSMYNLLISELDYHRTKGTLTDFISKINN